MIPYEELVVALQTWRARKGLPISQMSGSLTPPPPIAAPVAPPPRTAPPAAPPASRVKPAAPPPEHETLDAASLLAEDGEPLEEAHYENEGDDFAMAFPNGPAPDQEEGAESTQIGTPPTRPSGNDW